MNRMRIMLLVLLIVMVPSILRGEERPAVKVTFEMTEPSYTEEFTWGQMRGIRKEVLSKLIRKLNERIGFLKFSSGGRADYQLAVNLGPKEKLTSALLLADLPRKVGFYVELTGNKVTKFAYWPFRSEILYHEPIGTVDELKQLIEDNLNELDYTTKLINEALQFIPIANKGELWRDDLTDIGWVIPFSESELCMDQDTILKVINSFQVSDDLWISKTFSAKTNTDYRGNILSLAYETEKQKVDLKRLREVAIEKYRFDKVYVVDYKRIDTSCEVSVSEDATESASTDIAESTPADVADEL